MHPLTLHSSTSGPALKEPSSSEGISRLLLIWTRSNSKCLSHDKFRRLRGGIKKKKSDLGWFEQNSGQTGHWRRSQQGSATDTDVAVWCVCEPASRQMAFKTAAEIPAQCQTADNNVVWKVFLITYSNKTQTAAFVMCSAQIESETFHRITGNDTSATFRRDFRSIFCFVTTRLSDNKRGF